MFRVTNGRTNQIVEIEAKVLFSRIEGSVRKYDELKLERSRVTFFPLSWTVVHPIDEKSPMRGYTHADFVSKDAEFMILLAGIDETFSQTVHARSSYKPDEIVVGEKFVNIYNDVDEAASSASTFASWARPSRRSRGYPRLHPASHGHFRATRRAQK
jgi:inward rectifier potassium channel